MGATQRQKGSAFKPCFPAEVERGRLQGYEMYRSETNEPFGMFVLSGPKPYVFTGRLKVLVGDGLGWDHVSVSVWSDIARCPTWDEMNYIKDLFFREDATVIQFHPAKEHYVNNHEYVLHMWHKQGVEHELPPRECV